MDEQLFARSLHVYELSPQDLYKVVNGTAATSEDDQNTGGGGDREAGAGGSLGDDFGDYVYLTMLYSPRCGMTRLAAPFLDLVATQLANAAHVSMHMPSAIVVLTRLLRRRITPCQLHTRLRSASGNRRPLVRVEWTPGSRGHVAQ